MSNELERAAAAIADAEAMMIGAGAGMGVDSGLPDFRGDEGFWKNYPPFKKRGLNFYDLANPRWFHDDPELAWGFYGHRLHLYRNTTPHRGFDLLLEWSRDLDEAPFVFTSNVDGHFQRAGFSTDGVLECHGTILWLQCAEPCCDRIWSADDLEIEIDEETFRATAPLPECRNCGGMARPNVLMFGDMRWVADRTRRQKNRFQRWLETMRNRNIVVIESGAGTAVPTVRMRCEQVASRLGGTLIRINPRESRAPSDAISLEMGALEALEGIDERL